MCVLYLGVLAGYVGALAVSLRLLVPDRLSLRRLLLLFLSVHTTSTNVVEVSSALIVNDLYRLPLMPLLIVRF